VMARPGVHGPVHANGLDNANRPAAHVVPACSAVSVQLAAQWVRSELVAVCGQAGLWGALCRAYVPILSVGIGEHVYGTQDDVGLRCPGGNHMNILGGKERHGGRWCCFTNKRQTK
jgi:hypothetical protein